MIQEPAVVFEDDQVLVCVKPAGMPSAPLSDGEKGSLLDFAAQQCPQVLSVMGKKKVEGGLLHRIDTATTGLVLIAKNQKTWNFLSAEQDAGRFEKTYTAWCTANSFEGLSGCNVRYSRKMELPYVVRSQFRAYGEHGRGVKPVFADSGRADRKKAGKREYCTTIQSLEPVDDGREKQGTIVKVSVGITAGYRHQVRAHLAALGIPVLNDPLYPAIWLSETPSASRNLSDSESPMYFFASGLLVYLPDGKRLSLEMPESFLFQQPNKMTR